MPLGELPRGVDLRHGVDHAAGDLKALDEIVFVNSRRRDPKGEDPKREVVWIGDRADLRGTDPRHPILPDRFFMLGSLLTAVGATQAKSVLPIRQVEPWLSDPRVDA